VYNICVYKGERRFVREVFTMSFWDSGCLHQARIALLLYDSIVVRVTTSRRDIYHSLFKLSLVQTQVLCTFFCSYFFSFQPARECVAVACMYPTTVPYKSRSKTKYFEGVKSYTIMTRKSVDESFTQALPKVEVRYVTLRYVTLPYLTLTVELLSLQLGFSTPHSSRGMAWLRAYIVFVIKATRPPEREYFPPVSLADVAAHRRGEEAEVGAAGPAECNAVE
jgi:hypothetical protein